MKKILCFILSFMLFFNTTVVYADIGGTLPTPFPTLLPLPPDPAEFIIRLLLPDGGEALDYVSDWLEKRWSTDEDKSKDMSSDGNTVTFNSNFVNEFNAALQDKVHALDGYYLITPLKTYTIRDFHANYTEYEEKKFNSYLADTNFQFRWTSNYLAIYYFDTVNYLYYFNDSGCFSQYDIKNKSYRDKSLIASHAIRFDSNGIKYDYSSNVGVSGDGLMWNHVTNITDFQDHSMGQTFKVFYTKQDLQNYLNKGRTYVPQLPSGGFKVNIKYINNTTNLPDITYNITTENKTETEIQNQYDTTINNYLNGLDDFTDGGGSGDFGDGSPPTPTPPLGDGGSDQDGNGSDGWLKKIYDQLVKFSDSVSQHFEKEETFEDKLSKYLESHDKKLDAIVDAIDKLNQGKEEGEEEGCKYDYTKLSDFMTKLWNDSDQKFDKMIELLKENNEYQEKMLSTLNSIKNILLAQTVMDAFKNRSSETANKAKEKFPISVPWDIALIVNVMDAEPKAPVFELPVKIERLNIDEKITVDISSGEWEKLAKACRYMLSLLFVLFMVNLTRKLFFSKGDD